MAQTSIPAVLTGLRTLLLARPALAAPPAVAVHLLDAPPFADPEAIVWSRATMAGAAFVGWGAGEASLATVEPLTLAGYLYTSVSGNTETLAAAALTRAGVLLGEVMQQLRDDPTIGNALGTLTPPRRWKPPLMSTAVWTVNRSSTDGSGGIDVTVDFTITWSATT